MRSDELEERIFVADARSGSGAALDRLERRCRAEGLAEAIVIELRVAAEEVLTNVAKYAFEPGVAPAVEVRISFTEVSALVEFRDWGQAFDPLGEPPPDLETPPEDREPGGLGLALLRALVDEARYEREDGSNVLRLVKRRTPQ